jgi:hypothetical protein
MKSANVTGFYHIIFDVSFRLTQHNSQASSSLAFARRRLVYSYDFLAVSFQRRRFEQQQTVVVLIIRSSPKLKSGFLVFHPTFCIFFLRFQYRVSMLCVLLDVLKMAYGERISSEAK